MTITEGSWKEDVASKPSIYGGTFGSLKSIDGLCVIIGISSAGVRPNEVCEQSVCKPDQKNNAPETIYDPTT